MKSGFDNSGRKSGFVAILGLPNVGKSTLMNRLIGQKIAITSYKPQTTRSRIRTIYTDERGQIIFVDTPGVHTPDSGLGRYMYRASTGVIRDADLVLFLTEAKKTWKEEDEQMIALLKEAKAPVILVINKIDRVKKEELLPIISAVSGKLPFAEIYPVSAREGEGTDELLAGIFAHLPVGEPFYDEDMVTTETERDIVAEIVREKALRLLQEEVPHGIAVTVEKMKDRKTGSGDDICDIEATIICEKESHKGIIIGKGGRMLREIGTNARRDIENMLQRRAALHLYVKVRGEWRDSDAQLKHFGYDIRKI